jgi:hypothetical protein
MFFFIFLYVCIPTRSNNARTYKKENEIKEEEYRYRFKTNQPTNIEAKKTERHVLTTQNEGEEENSKQSIFLLFFFFIRRK